MLSQCTFLAYGFVQSDFTVRFIWIQGLVSTLLKDAIGFRTQNIQAGSQPIDSISCYYM